MTGSAVRRIAAAAALVAAITVVARVVGFGRWLVFSKTVGAGCLADAYTTANQLPNVLFEVVVGGALAGAVIPVLSGADRSAQGRIVSALLTWSIVLLAPVAVIAWVLAGTYTDTMLDGCPGSAATAARMLVIFVPQVFGYAVAVIATAVLQSHHRFAAGALAPLVSSAVVIATYVLFAGRAPDADQASRGAVDLLAWGTTLGVLALALTVLVPMLALRLPVRPMLRFDGGVGPVVRRLALAGLAALVAQQVAFVVITYLANHRGTDGSVALYTWAYAIYLLPYAVLVQPLTTAVFPRLATAFSSDSGYESLTASSTRAVLLASGLGAAVLGATAVPVAWVFVYDDGMVSHERGYALADALIWLGPALIGFGALMHGGRVLYARHAGRAVAVVTVAAWVVTAVVGIVVTTWWTGADVVQGLGAGMAAGMLAGGAGMLAVVRRIAGAVALSGVVRTAVIAFVAAAVAGVAGRIVASPVTDGGWVAGLFYALLSGLAGLIVYGALMWLLVGHGTREDLRKLVRRRGRTA